MGRKSNQKSNLIFWANIGPNIFLILGPIQKKERDTNKMEVDFCCHLHIILHITKLFSCIHPCKLGLTIIYQWSSLSLSSLLSLGHFSLSTQTHNFISQNNFSQQLKDSLLFFFKNSWACECVFQEFLLAFITWYVLLLILKIITFKINFIFVLEHSF